MPPTTTKPPHPDGYSKDNGYGYPTHVFSRHRQEWIATPPKYRTRKDGFFRSHVLLFNKADGTSEWYTTPTMKQLEEWSMDSVCESPFTVELVEPDHPDSWLTILGMI